MSNQNPPSTRSSSSVAKAISGAGGLSAILIAFANIGFKESEYLAAITTTIPFVVGGLFTIIEYSISYLGVRSKTELEVDAKLDRKLTQVNQFIDESIKSIKQNQETGLDSSAEEKNLEQLQARKRDIQLAYINLAEIEIKAVEGS